MTHCARFKRYLWSILLIGLLVCPAAVDSAIAQPNRPRSGNRGGSGPDDDPTDTRKADARQQEKAQRLMEEGQQLLDKGDVIRAKARFKGAAELAGMEGVGPSAIAALVSLHERGMSELAKAREQFENKEFGPALTEARRIKHVYSNLFGTLPVAVDRANISVLANKLIKEIQGHPEGRAAFEDEKADRLRRKIAKLERQVKKDRSKLFDLYSTCRRVIERYPNSTTAKACSERVKALKADRKSWQLIGEEGERRNIASTLAKIASLEKEGQHEKAEKLLSRLLIQHPGSNRAALEARAKRKVK